MGYNRTKTCRYCYGNHSVMDCTKLQEDAKKAQTSLDALRSDKAMREHIFRTIVKRYSYSYKSAGNDTNTHILKPIDENSWQEHRWTFRRYLGESYEDVANEQAYKDFYSTLSAEISDEQDDVHRSEWSKIFSPREHQHIIDKAEEARKSKQKRANKSCSYCKNTGHTARTCPVKKKDMEMHYNAHKIACYLTARACARFGFWTGSMVMTQDGIKIWKNIQTTRLFSSAPIITSSDKLSDDEIDYVYLTELTDNKIYFNIPDQPTNRHRYGSSARLEIGRKPSGFARVDWENNKLPVLEPNENGSYGYARVIGFYPTTIDLSHIYHRIIQSYLQPQTTTRKYDSPTINIFDGNSFRRAMDEDNDYNFWSHGSDLFYKKERRDDTWQAIRDFVENNKDILNKIEELTV